MTEMQKLARAVVDVELYKIALGGGFGVSGGASGGQFGDPSIGNFGSPAPATSIPAVASVSRSRPLMAGGAAAGAGARRRAVGGNKPAFSGKV